MMSNLAKVWRGLADKMGFTYEMIMVLQTQESSMMSYLKSRKLLTCPRLKLDPKGNGMMAKWLQGNLRAQWAARTMVNVQAKTTIKWQPGIGKGRDGDQGHSEGVTDSHDAA
eukprot:Em0024g104a